MTNPTRTITHDAFHDGLMAHLENETDDAARAAMERHARDCAECGALLADLRDLRAESAGLPALTPSRDLWSGIAARIEAPVVPIGAVSAEHPVPTATDIAAAPTRGRRWMRGALIAASLVGAVGIGYLSGAARGSVGANTDSVAQDGPGALASLPGSLIADSATLAGGAPVPASTRLAVVTLAADYDREIARLGKLLDERRNQLDPATVSIIEKNLRVIDAAITESKNAIARDPASRFLIESLNQSLVSKVELLRVAAALPSRT